MIKKLKTNTYENGVLSAVGKNSAVFTEHCFVNKVANILDVATVGWNITGIAMSAATMASDNETVAKAEVNYEVQKDSTTYLVPIVWWTVTVDDEGKYYDLKTSESVDGTTESTTTGQLKLVKFHSATSCEFVIANA